MKILITGSNGLLGQKLVSYCQAKNIEYLATSKGANRNSNCPSDVYCEMDITNADEVMETITGKQPTRVIHTAAMTNVDQCENDPEGCELVNVVATENLVLACNATGSHFQLLSTDFVFV